jgi:hypothetical protein
MACAAAQEDPVTLPHRLCLALVQALRVDGAAIAAHTDTPLGMPLGASDDLADTLETVQFTTGEGPCVQAAVTGHPVLVGDLHTQAPTQWPAFADIAARRLRGIGAVFAFPLRFDDTTLGSVNLYSRARRTLKPTEITDASDAVAVAALALLSTPGPVDTDPSPPSPTRADPWQSMHLAIGMIAAQLHLAPGDALAHLRAYAFTHTMLLSELATDVLNHRIDATDLRH